MALVMLFSQSALVVNASPATVEDGGHSPAQESNRLIVELASPPLAVAFRSEVSAAAVNGKLDANVPAAQAYISQLQAEQAAFVSTMQSAVAGTSVASFINETGAAEAATYQVVLNGLSVDVGPNDRATAMNQIAKLPGVKNVYLDVPYHTDLYTSTALINAPVLWNEVGGRSGAGAGIKVASMDGGVHHEAPMMDGTGYIYPPGYGPNGLGLTANNNGKIIASRVYFRPWDPPAPGDENPWPGDNGTSHGMHTSSTAAGDVVTATYLGFNVGEMSGVAPKAYVMSYRVFYESVNSNGSFYTTEGIAALEDIVRDGADVVNNSWGGGPGSLGGAYDALDQALINAVNAGIFVSMSNGNAGPGLGTSDHPSPDYINVAASTTGGTLAAGRVSVPNQPALQDIAFASSSFGAPLPIAQVQNYDYVPASVVDPGNVEGCDPFPANAFAGKAALISRGTCEFGVKVLNAEQAGADFAVVYNSAAGGDGLISMGEGAVGNQVTISSIFIGKTNGDALVTLYNDQGAAAAVLQIDTTAFQAGNTPDQIIAFSSRGPGVGGTLKPDIAAPGVNILAQGYAEGVTGEARHLGYGQVSGTSMAAPHVAGAAALVKQVHPNWSPAWIKSALMSTAKYMDIYLADGETPAQPLDMGAGRLDLTNATDPGVILDPPSLSFGYTVSGTQKTISVTVTSVANVAETYNLSTLYTGNGFAPTQTTSLPGFTVAPTSLALNPGESKTIQVTFNPAAGNGIGDNQGYLIMDGANYDAHMAAWARVTPAVPLADVLIIDNDFSEELGETDYLWYYTSALESLGYSYSVISTEAGVGNPTTIPDAATLAGYRAIIYFTGDNYRSDGTFTVSTGLTALDMDRLVEYLNQGGTVIAMGQDLAAVLGADETDSTSAPFLYNPIFGANWIQDSVSNSGTPQSYIVETTDAPAILNGTVIDLTRPRALAASGPLSGTQEVPPVTTTTTGSFNIFHDIDREYTEFAVTVVPSATQGITLTGMHIHVGDVGVNGPVIANLATSAGITLPLHITESLTVNGVVTPSLTMTQVQQMASDGTYINVHTTVNPGGEIRGQIEPSALGNQRYVDEIDNHYHNGNEDPTGMDNLDSIPLLKYQGPFNLYGGTVALGHREQPSLENPGVTYNGRSVYASFGLEGMSNDFSPTLGVTPTTRSELLGAFLDWSWSQPPTTVTISDTVEMSSTLYIFDATAAYGVQASSSNGAAPVPVQYRWDFGDGSPYLTSVTSQASHTYLCGDDNTHTVRIEITDNYGNVVIGTQEIDVSSNCSTNAGPDSVLFMPIITNQQ
jgi:subtilisin family serine protease